MGSYGKKQPKQSAAKVTAAMRAAKREEDAKAHEQLLEQRRKDARRETSEGDYEKMVDVQNTNRTERMIDASGIDDVVKQLANAELSTPPGSPGAGFVKRSKGAYMEYEEHMMVTLKADQPGLKMSQYKEMVFKSWKKAPENPENSFMS